MDPSYIEEAILYAENKGLNVKAIIPVIFWIACTISYYFRDFKKLICL